IGARRYGRAGGDYALDEVAAVGAQIARLLRRRHPDRVLRGQRLVVYVRIENAGIRRDIAVHGPSLAYGPAVARAPTGAEPDFFDWLLILLSTIRGCRQCGPANLKLPAGRELGREFFFRVAAARALRAVSILKVIRGHVADSPQVRSRGPAGNAPFPHRPCIVLAILAASRHGETGRLQWRPSPASLPMGF